MPLKVIGSGLPRTGTLSLKLALELLGYGPCHHMMDLRLRPERRPLWAAAQAGQPDWEAIFDGFVATVDAPGCGFWRELAACYPQAQVVHTVRDPDAWFESNQATVFSPEALARRPPPSALFPQEFWERSLDRSFMVKMFEAHNARVRTDIPPERLLIFEASQGWAPLCAFLSVPVPDEPYPQINSAAEWNALMRTARSTPGGMKAAIEAAGGAENAVRTAVIRFEHNPGDNKAG